MSLIDDLLCPRATSSEPISAEPPEDIPMFVQLLPLAQQRVAQLDPETLMFYKNLRDSFEVAVRSEMPLKTLCDLLYKLSDKFLDPEEFSAQLMQLWGEDLAELLDSPAAGRNLSIIPNYFRLQDPMFSGTLFGFLIQYYRLELVDSTYRDEKHVQMQLMSTEILCTRKDTRMCLVSKFSKFIDCKGDM